VQKSNTQNSHTKKNYLQHKVLLQFQAMSNMINPQSHCAHIWIYRIIRDAPYLSQYRLE